MHRAPTHRFPTPMIEQFGKPTSNTIPTIIRGYKSAVTKQININRAYRSMPQQTIWQRNYWEHIIRNAEEWDRINEYIINNLDNWEMDELFLS